MTADTAASRPRGAVAEVFVAFLRLGFTAFGGPIAHIGYFRTEFVERRRWLGDRAYADLVALCQFLPGPASSQVGFALGLSRAGPLGALAAWTAFTLPSALIMLAVASGLSAMDGPVATGALRGLKAVAVAVIAQAIWGMARTLCPDRERASIAAGAAILVILVPGSLSQVGAILLGGIIWWALGRGDAATDGDDLHLRLPRGVALAFLAGFLLLLIGLPIAASLVANPTLAIVDASYRAGALVFGGGHVVLPLLQASFVGPGWVSTDTFLAGYGAAQALPGPLFTFGAFLGAASGVGPGGWAGALIGLLSIFLPGMLVLLGAVPFWDQLRRRPGARKAMAGVNAAVVGLLLAALYDPVWTGSIHGPLDFAVALGGFLLLAGWKMPPWAVVVLAAAVGAGRGHFGI